MTAAVETPTRLPGPGCPDNDTLHCFLTGRLSETEAEPVEHHLEGCPSCLDRLGKLSAHERRLGETCAGGSEPGAVEGPETVMALIQRLCRAPTSPGPSTANLSPNPLPWQGRGQGEGLPGDLPAVGRREPPSGPAQLGRYHVRRLLGAGGMGTVYLADDPDLGRPVAVKVPQFAGPPEVQAAARQRFLREARAAAAVRHSHVRPIYDVGEQDGTPYVVMAFIEGCSLAERLKGEGRFADPRAAVALAVQLAEGLAAVHDCGLIHRDLKPANVLLGAAGDVFLSDFGLARRHDDESLTASGALVGTLAYMAPEQADDSGGLGPVTGRTDLYSLSVLLYELLTGRLPFAAQSSISLLYQIVHGTPSPPREFRPDLDPALEAIVLKAMARQPQERYADARELAKALRNWPTRETNAPVEGVPPPPPTTSAGGSPSTGMRLDLPGGGSATIMLDSGTAQPGKLTVTVREQQQSSRRKRRKLLAISVTITFALLLGVLALISRVAQLKPPDQGQGAEQPPRPKPPNGQKPGEQLLALKRPPDLAAVAQALIQSLNHEDVLVRREAARGLASRKHPEVVKALGRALGDQDARVRREAAHSLRKLGDQAAVPDLMKRLADDVWGKVAPRRPRLASEAKADTNPYEDVAKEQNQGSRYAALEALKALDPAKVPEALLAATQSRNADIRWWTVRQLGNLPTRKDEKRPAVVKALGRALGGVCQLHCENG
ncbi:MAG: protein kinase, partial [Gemmataceae bacterium]|nr:protein kinase [Gemmataceae bacterium]